MTKAPPLEKTITNAILKYLNSIRMCRARKIPGTSYGSGWPDIIAVIYGMPLFIEVKRPGLGKRSEPTELQEAELNKWYDAGAQVMCAHSVAEVKEFIFNLSM